METPLTYSVDQVAAIFGVGRSTVYDLVRSSKLRGIRVGRRVLIPRSEVERFLRSNI